MGNEKEGKEDEYILVKEIFYLTRLELKRVMGWRYVAAALLFAGIAFVLLQAGIAGYNRRQSMGYEAAGVDALTSSAPDRCTYLLSTASVFTGPPDIPVPFQVEVTPLAPEYGKMPYHNRIPWKAPAGWSLPRLSVPLISSGLFESRVPEFLSFQGFILYGGTLMGMFFGYAAFRDRNYLMFLEGLFRGSFFAYLVIYVFRMFLVWVYLNLLYGAAFRWTEHFGIPLHPHVRIANEYIRGISFFIILIFFILGALAAEFRKPGRGGMVLAVCWLGLMVVFPGVIHYYMVQRAAATPTEIPDQWTAADKAQAATYYYRRIMNRRLETAAYFPVNYWRLAMREAGGYGPRGMINIYQYLKWQAYDDARQKPVPVLFPGTYIPNIFHFPNESIFLYSSSPFSGYNKAWIYFLAFAIIHILMLFFKFSRRLPRPMNAPGSAHLDIAMDPGGKYFFHAPDGFICSIFNRLSGFPGLFCGSMTLGDKELSYSQEAFIYLDGGHGLPGRIRVRSFVSFISGMRRLNADERKALKQRLKPYLSQPFMTLDMDERAEVMTVLAGAARCEFVMLVNITDRMTPKGLKGYKKLSADEFRRPPVLLYFSTIPGCTPPLAFDTRKTVYESDGKYQFEEL